MPLTYKPFLPTAKKWSELSAFFVTMGLFLAVTQVSAAPLPTEQELRQSATAAGATVPLPGISPVLDPASQMYPFRDAYAYVPYGMPHAHAVLSVAQTQMRQVRRGQNPSGEQFTVDIRLYNDSGDFRNFYNLYWNPFIPEPGRLALYDSQKHYICDLLERMGGSQTTIGAGAWAGVPASGYVGMVLSVSLPYPTYITLPPGAYYLQVIYLPRVIQPFSEANTFFYSDHTELFRSNVVPITVVEQPAVRPSKRTPTP